jgi:melanoma-associated antigen p97
MQITDCNNHVKTATAFFGPSCAVNSLVNKYNPIGDNSDKLCTLCTGVIPGGKCTQSDPYTGFEGAFRCLMEAGDIAFLKHTTVDEMVKHKAFKGIETDQFQLLCRTGQRMPLAEYRQCNWGRVPSHAVVTSSARSADNRKLYQRFMQKAVARYSRKSLGTYNDENFPSNTGNRFNETQNRNRNDDSYYNPNDRYNSPWSSSTTTTTDRYNRFDSGRNYEERNDRRKQFDSDDDNFNMTSGGQPYENFAMFESGRYGGRLNLMFQDAARTLLPIKEENQNFAHYLGDAMDLILEVRQCPVGRMTLCVTSDPEMEKCVKMRVSVL